LGFFGQNAVKQEQLIAGEACKSLLVRLQNALASLDLLFFPQTAVQCLANHGAEVHMAFLGDPFRQFQALRWKSKSCSP